MNEVIKKLRNMKKMTYKMTDNEIILIKNDNKDIAGTNYFKTDLAKKKKVVASLNAECIRLLVPQTMVKDIEELKKKKKVYLYNVCNESQRERFYSFVFEDDYTILVSTDLFLGKPEDKIKWDFSVWTEEEEKPVKIMESNLIYRYRVKNSPV